MKNDADTVLGMLCSTYYELNCNQDTDEIKQAFDERYQVMTGKNLKEKDEVIYATCRLCPEKAMDMRMPGGSWSIMASIPIMHGSSTGITTAGRAAASRILSPWK